MSLDGKEKGKEGKRKMKLSMSEVLKELSNHSKATQDVKDLIDTLDLDQEFDEVKICKAILKFAEISLKAEAEHCVQTNDPFDRLLKNQTAPKEVHPIDDSSIEFYLAAVKKLANSNIIFEGMTDLLQKRFKQPLIKLVLSEQVPDNLRMEASLVSEFIMDKNKYEDYEGDQDCKWISVYLWVVKLCLKPDSVNRADLKRVWSMRKLLGRYTITPGSPVFDVLAASVISTNFLAHKEGRQHIGYLLSLDSALISSLQAKIKTALPLIFEKSKTLACNYGEVFNLAWTNALPPVRQALEDKLLQRWMEIYLTLDRPRGIMQSQFGKVIFRILSYLHNSRRLLEMSSAITRLYRPILWRALKCHHPWERCNAAELFLDVFPLELPCSNIVDNSNFKEKQIHQLLDLLTDECHYIRIVAIKGMVPIMERKMEVLSNVQCKEILSLLSNTLTNDCSTHLVRVAVWEFFTSLVESDDPPVFLEALLPQMTNHFHDVNEQVRKAFATMLLQMSKNDKMTLCYTAVAPMPHIICRLALDNEPVGKVIVQLIMDSIYSEGMQTLQFIKHIKRLILMSPKAAENLFRWSPHVLTPANAKFIILSILVYLRAFTKEKIEGRLNKCEKSTNLTTDSTGKDTQVENGDLPSKENMSSAVNVPNESISPSASPVKKKRKKSKEGKKLSLLPPQCLATSAMEVDGPTAEIHAHLLGCAHVTWIVFFNQFEREPGTLEELYTVLTVCLQNYLRCYKGTPAWYAALSLASLVPIAKLSENTTASSACLGELRRTELSTPITHTQTLIYTLTAWNRGNEIIDLATDYIDPAFRLYHLNSTTLAMASSGKKTRGRNVRFAKDKGREMIGLRLLTLLFKDYHNEQRLITKYRDNLHELFHYLDGIKTIVETAVTEGIPEKNAQILTQEFIVDCLVLMLKLIPVLHQESSDDSQDVPFDGPLNMINILDWATRLLIPLVKETEESPSDENCDNVLENSEDEDSDEDQGKKRKKKKNKDNKKKKDKTEKKEEVVQVDLVAACLKAVMKTTTFMVKIDMTDYNHCTASAKFALSLIQSDGCYWFVEEGLDLVEAIGDHVRAWQPEDENQLLGVAALTLYSHLLLSLTAKTNMTLHTLKRHNLNLMVLKRKIIAPSSLLLTMYKCSHESFKKILTSSLEGCITAVHMTAMKIEAIDPVKKMDELPLGVILVTTCLMCQSKLTSLVLSTIVNIIKHNIEDGIMVLCCLSYMYTLILNCKKFFLQLDMERTVHVLYPIVTSLSNSQTSPENELDDSFFADPLSKIDVTKEGIMLLRKIADAIPCSLVSPSSEDSSQTQ